MMKVQAHLLRERRQPAEAKWLESSPAVCDAGQFCRTLATVAQMPAAARRMQQVRIFAFAGQASDQLKG